VARKSNSDSGEGINLDSLMDALTNVVAVLILVLILVQADVTQKVIQFTEDLQPATPEQVEQAKILLAEAVAKKQSIEEKLQQDAPTPEQLEEEKRRIALLEKSIQTNDKLLADLNELKILEAKVRQERDAENLTTVRIQEEIAKLEAQLDQTPVIKAPPPTEVNIPNSRPIPPKAVVYHALAIRDRIHMIDPHTPLAMFEEEFRKHRRDWLAERIKRQGGDRLIYDPTKIAAHFKTFDFKSPPGQKTEIITQPVWPFLQIAITPDLGKGGTPLDALEKPGSEFSKTVARLMSNIRNVVLFHVNPDSFNTYLKARGLIDKTKVPAGWEVWGGNSWRFTIPDVEVKRLQEPPPPPPQAGPKPPPPVGPKLD
jgi:hypothetical protein